MPSIYRYFNCMYKVLTEYWLIKNIEDEKKKVDIEYLIFFFNNFCCNNTNKIF